MEKWNRQAWEQALHPYHDVVIFVSRFVFYLR